MTRRCGMETKRAYAVPLLLCVIALVSVVLGAYTGAYFLRGERSDYLLPGGMYVRIRTYKTAREAKFFSSVAKIESFVTGVDVSTREVPVLMFWPPNP
jgi:hypothetical protein